MNDMSGVIQAERILRIESPLGPDVLLPERMQVAEGVSRLFEISLALRSKRMDLTPQDLVGELVDVSLELGGGLRRTWNGLVTNLLEGPRESRTHRSYHLTIRPEHWLLSQNADCRIFLDRTSVEIAEILLAEHGLAAPVTAGVANPVPRQHYSVQWNETDLDYLTRRLEADGLFFWFEHEGGAEGQVAARHVMHIANHPVGYTSGPETDVRFAMGSTDRNHVNGWERTFSFVPAARAGRDWNFETPDTVPGGEMPGLFRLPRNGGRALYEYPAIDGYGSGTRASEGIDDAEVERRAKLRMQATEADHERVTGASNVRTLAAGRRFRPYDIANPDNLFEEHVVSAVRMTAVDRSYETQSDEPEYRNEFEAVPSRVPLTPHRDTRLSGTRNTPRPRIEGTQIAIVAGPPGEEIHPDEYGRIKVWFPWDRRAKQDGSDTCWIRVGQTWAGATFGAQTIPRIGMEVLVTYIDGDPDRPMVIGVVPNKRQKVPYELPANKTKTVFRTNTHQSKDWTKFNELSFEDEAGREKIYMHGQKDQEIHIENNRAKRIDNNQSESVGHNKSIEVGNNHHEVIGGNMTLMVGPNVLQQFVTQAFSAFTDRISGLADKLGVPNLLDMGEGNLVVGVGKNKAETVMVASSEIVGAAKSTTVGGGYQLTVGGVKNESVAVGSWEEVGQTKVTVVGHKYEIVCGKSRIVMDRDGTIRIEGVKLLVTEEDSVQMKAKRIDLNP